MQQYVVVAFRDGEPDRQCVLKEAGCVVGRIPEADLVLSDTTISRQHAVLRIANGRVRIQDLSSTNGVFVNGEQVQQSVVHEGDFMSVGAYTVVIRSLEETDQEAQPRGKTFCIGYDAARRLHEESLEKQGSKQSVALYKAALLLGQRLPRADFLREVLGLVSHALPARNGSVVLCTEDLSRQEVAGSFSLDQSSNSLPPSRTLVDYVLRTRTAMLTEDAQTDPRFSSAETVIRRRIGAAMCVPLCGSRQSAGAFYVDAGKEKGRFSKQDLGFLTAIAHVLGVAVENQLLDERNAKQQQLVELGRAVAEISHDMRGIFTAILGGVDLLGNSLRDGDQKRAIRSYEMVRAGAEQAERYMADLLLFVKKTELQRTPTHINGLIRDVLELTRPLARQRGVELAFRGGGFERANLDGQQVHRALGNIIKNAVEACPEGSGKVTVSVSRQGTTLVIQVRDTGCGIAAEDLPRLAAPFFSEKGSAGTGLGLAISYRIVEQHGGRIVVDSRVGEGTVFTVFFPEVADGLDSTGLVSTPVPSSTVGFKRCPGCSTAWATQDDFLSDPAVVVSGYQVFPDDLAKGLFLFDHTCGTTLAVPAGDFRHLYDGPIYKQCLAGTENCPRYCEQMDEFRPCTEKCERAHIREALQIVRNWPKQKQ